MTQAKPLTDEAFNAILDELGEQFRGVLLDLQGRHGPTIFTELSDAPVLELQRVMAEFQGQPRG